MLKSNGGSGSVSNLVLENFIGHSNAYSMNIEQYWESMKTLPGDGVQLSNIKMIKKTMMQIMLQTEIPRLLAPQTMYSKQSPTAPPDPTLPYLTFSSVAEHLHNLTPLPSDSLRTRTQICLSTSLSTLGLPLRAAALKIFPSRLLQSGIRQA